MRFLKAFLRPVLWLCGGCFLLLHGASAHPSEPTEGLGLSPFAIGSCYVNNRSVQDNARWIPQMAAIGIHTIRTAHTDWGSVEPEAGRWTWQSLDRQISYLASNHLACGGLLIGNVPWDKSGQGAGLPVKNLAAWSNYVAAIVGHLRGTVKCWEVWNEPPNFIGPNQTPSDYAHVVVAAYDAAKAADPHCQVGLAAKSVHVNYLEQVVLAGAKDHFDYITLHPYEVLGTVADNAGTEAVFMNIVPVVRKMLAARDPAKRNVPIVFTELGADARRSAARQAAALVKAYSMGIAQGVASIEWFEGRDGDSGPMGLLDPNGTPRPAYTAMAQLIEHLGQHPEYLGWMLLNGRHYAFVFQGAKAKVLVAWAYRGQTDRVDLGQKALMVDPLTGRSAAADQCELTSDPILLIGVPDRIVAKARANKDRPLTWGGEYAQATSVSISLGTTNIERGLHTLSGDAIATDVVAYGGPARAGSIPGGNAFAVDPAFLSYTPTPIEITVVVRRNPSNDNSGFKLVYESTNGFKNLGWFTVPDNRQWHTKTWRILDPQFVNMWGFNFELESDGNQYNKYYLQQVTVRKVGGAQF